MLWCEAARTAAASETGVVAGMGVRTKLVFFNSRLKTVAENRVTTSKDAVALIENKQTRPLSPKGRSMPPDACDDPTPDRKRPRTYSNPDEHRKVFTNHPTLYFEDGNVILKCGWTLFCVHRSLLSKHSEVFRGLFTPAQAGAEVKPQEFFRGCLFIALDDNSNDMESLLDTIYDGL